MLFKVGDSVFHPAHGVGYIIQIEEMEFSTTDERQLYYQATFGPFSEVNVWIPVETQEASGMRFVTPKSELDQYRNVLRRRPKTPVTHRPQRRVELADQLKQGTFQVMCEVVRDLTLSKRHRTLVPSDAVTLKQTRELLLQEWAAVADISIKEATKELRLLLRPDLK